MMIQWRLSLAAGLISLALAGCSSQPEKQAQAQQPLTPMQQATALIHKAGQSQPIQAAQLRAEAARILISLERREEAQVLLQDVDIQLLPPALKFDIARLKAEAALEQENPEQALAYLELLPKRSAELSPEQDLISTQLRAAAYDLQQDSENQLRELIYAALLQEDPEQQQALHNQIWAILNSFKSAELQQLLSKNNSYYEQGWFELSQAVKSSSGLAARNQAISEWMILWEAHPAHETPPQGQATASAEIIQATKVAVILPESGNLAKPAEAIRNGLLAAYYSAQQNGETTPELTFIDSATITDPQQLVAMLNEQQADLAIGPLDKNYVSSLTLVGDLPLPILALNLSSDELINQNLFQFGLSAESEAEQVAERMWQDGHRVVLAISADANWGRKALDAFSARFRNLGGTVADHSLYADTAGHSDRIAALLATDKSRDRGKTVRSLVGKSIKFEERRRKDADAIFMAALPNDARQLKPIVDFYYAADLPVYATSHIYSGQTDANSDRDLNKIRFCGSPWNLKAPSAEHLLLAQQHDNTRGRFGRLYALGLDAYRIYPFLRQLAANPDASISGETGELSIAENNRINRNLSWAIYRQGVPALEQ